MGKLIAVPLTSDSDVEIMFSTPTAGGPKGFAFTDDVIEKGSSTLASAMDMVRAIGQCAADKLAGLDIESAEASVGIKLTGTGKFVVAEASAEASLTVKFVLKRKLG